MLFPSFSKKIIDSNKAVLSQYKLPSEIEQIVIRENSSFDTVKEYRLQECFTEEIWQKLADLSIASLDLENRDVLDICGGSGFLSYHLLKRSKINNLTIADISESEIDHARQLFADFPQPLKYYVGDIIRSDIPDGSFDIIIGNSFLHHFYNVPEALSKIMSLLKNGGIFISLHEPTPNAVAYESGSFKNVFKLLTRGQKEYISSIRYDGVDLAPNTGSDVWLFTNKDVKRLLTGAGFKNIKVSSWNIYRSFSVARNDLHLSESRQSLDSSQIKQFRRAVKIDKILKKLVPSSLWGAVSFMAQKP